MHDNCNRIYDLMHDNLRFEQETIILLIKSVTLKTLGDTEILLRLNLRS